MLYGSDHILSNTKLYHSIFSTESSGICLILVEKGDAFVQPMNAAGKGFMPTKAQVLGIQLKEVFIGRKNLLFPQTNKIGKLLVILSIAGLYVFHILATV